MYGIITFFIPRANYVCPSISRFRNFGNAHFCTYYCTYPHGFSAETLGKCRSRGAKQLVTKMGKRRKEEEEKSEDNTILFY